MCGIYSIFNRNTSQLRHIKIQPRGPDDVKVVTKSNSDMIAAFYRLAIVGRENGMQPFIDDENDTIVLCNGEIYNHRSLVEEYKIEEELKSDCDVITHLYQKTRIEQLVRSLKGEFAFIIIDIKLKLVHFARDPMGVKPLYYSIENDDVKDNVNENDDRECKKTFELSSIIDAMVCKKPQHVVPGFLYTYDLKSETLSKLRYKEFMILPNKISNKASIYEKLKNAVVKRIQQSERPLGFFLSGGIDSCTILSIALKEYTFSEPPKVFTFGFHDQAPDVVAARKMVEWLYDEYGEDCIDWHLIIQPVKAGINALNKVIHALETYDTTTIRASTPMYLLSKYISRNTDVKVLLTGEGSDELFGGYLYNLYAPNDYAFREEIITSLNNLYIYDVLRADRVTACHGLEIRPPFLDTELIDEVLGYPNLVNTSTNLTKMLLRNIIAEQKLLPDVILYGRKEAFSDAVGLCWQDEIETFANSFIKININKNKLAPHINAKTKTAQYFQSEFCRIFGKKWYLLPKYWLPNQDWVQTDEPSARALAVYND